MSGGTVFFASCTFRNNIAQDSASTGGAIFISGGTATFLSATFLSNKVRHGMDWRLRLEVQSHP